MALDAGFLAAVAAELKQIAMGARIEKVYQPERDTVVLQMRTFEGGKRLLINAGSANPRVGFTAVSLENPQNPPQFCVLLRKHLSGAKLISVSQPAFERVLVFEWETRDEMADQIAAMLTNIKPVIHKNSPFGYSVMLFYHINSIPVKKKRRRISAILRPSFGDRI